MRKTRKQKERSIVYRMRRNGKFIGCMMMIAVTGLVVFSSSRSMAENGGPLLTCSISQEDRNICLVHTVFYMKKMAN